MLCVISKGSHGAVCSGPPNPALTGAAAAPLRRQEPPVQGSDAQPQQRARAQTIPSCQSRAGHWSCRDELCNLLLRGFSVSPCPAVPIHSLPDKSLSGTNPAQPSPVTSSSGMVPPHLSPSCTSTCRGLFSRMEQPTTHPMTSQPPS